MDIVKTKIVDETGKSKGKAYTYKSVIEVKVGDLVIADMAGTLKKLQVVETGLPQSEIDGLDYEIKLIDCMYEGNEDLIQNKAKLDLIVNSKTMPEIVFNFEDIKQNLNLYLSKFEKLEVTSDTLKGCKATRKELAGLRNKLNRFRIDEKEKMSVPIATFEQQCNDLILMIDKIEAPIKNSIKVFDDKRKAKKAEEAQVIRQEIIAKIGLNEKYSAMLTLIDKYKNLGAKRSDVEMDLTVRAEVLKEKQDKEQELIEIIQSTIDAENTKINQKLHLSDFDNMFDAGASTKIILDEVRLRAATIYAAENLEPEPEKEIEPPVQPTPPEEPEPAIEVIPTRRDKPKRSVEPSHEPQKGTILLSGNSMVSATYRCTGTLDELRGLSEWLRTSAIQYEVIEQKVLG